MNERTRMIKPLLKGLPIIILVMFLAVMVAKKYLNYVTPMYESTAKLKIADVDEGVTGANLYKDLDVFASSYKIATEIEVLKSDLLIEKTLKKLSFNLEIYRKGDMQTVELFNNSPIVIEGTFQSEKALDKRYLLTITSEKEFLFFYPNSETSFKCAFGKPFAVDGGKFLITLNEDLIQKKKNIKIVDSYEFEFLSEQKLLDKINKNIDIVSVDKDVPVVRINLKSNVPEKAALFVNKLAETYIQDYIESKYKAADTTVGFLNEEILNSNKNLEASEKDILDYRNEKNIINVNQETETDLRKIAQLKIQLINVKMNLDAIKELNKYMQSGKNKYLELAPNFEAFSDLLSTEIMKNMKRLQSDKKDLLLTYTPENEKVKAVDAKLEDLGNYQMESIKNTETNLQIKYDELLKEIKESEKVFAGLPEKEKILNILNRDFSIYEKNYNFLNEKRIEAEIARAAKIAFHKIIAPAVVAKEPISPIRSIIFIVAAFLGMMGSIVLIYIIHFARAKVNDAYTIEKTSTIPIAIATPCIKQKENIKNNFLKEAMQMELKGMIEPQAILVITSYDNAKDHLFHSKNLTQAFIAQQRKILVIDATGQLQNKVDKNDYLDFSDPKYLSYTKTVMQNTIREKMVNYDFCIIHNQAIKEEKLALLFMSLATQNLVVLDSQKTAQKTIIHLELLKDEYQLPNFWFVLNKSGYNPPVVVEIQKIWVKYHRKQIA